MLEIYHFSAFTSPCEVHLYIDNKEKADECAKAILKEIKRLEKKYNYFDENSYLNSLNNRTINELDNETKNILTLAKQFYQLTNKIFDITIATIKNIFDENIKKDLLPYVGCEHFTIKKNKLYFDNEFTKLDLGGVIKEYGVDRAVKIIKKYKIASALVNFGGDIYALGKKPNGTKFSVGVKNPLQTDKILFSVEIENEALTTSASYERYHEIEGERHSHIIRKDFQKEKILSATVVSDNCLKSGVYSTTFMIDDSVHCDEKYYLIENDLNIKKFDHKENKFNNCGSK